MLNHSGLQSLCLRAYMRTQLIAMEADSFITSPSCPVSCNPSLPAPEGMKGFCTPVLDGLALGWGKGYFSLAIAIARMPSVIQTIRAAVLSVREKEFISAAKVLGKSDWYIITRHVMRNIYSTILVQFCSTYGASIVACSVLGYLEIGISSPVPEWGRMVADYFHLIQSRGHLVSIPCLFISVSVLCITMITHGLRDALDPKEYQHE